MGTITSNGKLSILSGMDSCDKCAAAGENAGCVPWPLLPAAHFTYEDRDSSQPMMPSSRCQTGSSTSTSMRALLSRAALTSDASHLAYNALYAALYAWNAWHGTTQNRTPLIDADALWSIVYTICIYFVRHHDDSGGYVGQLGSDPPAKEHLAARFARARRRGVNNSQRARQYRNCSGESTPTRATNARLKLRLGLLRLYRW